VIAVTTGFVYNPLLLSVYDQFVIGFSNMFVWSCPSQELLALYCRNVSDRHLDIGVGTGYFLDRVRFPRLHPAITLLDVNATSLSVAPRQIARYEPRVVRADALAPLPIVGLFSSVGLCYLLHCLPGSIAEKAIVLGHIKAVMAPDARVFGATIVQGSAPKPWLTRQFLSIYNSTCIFSIDSDTIEDLETQLASRFSNVNVTLQGSVALFEAQGLPSP
jgi:SAM-dependent methyltransferase